MADFSGEHSTLVKDAPIDSENSFFDHIDINGSLSKLDNIGGEGGEVVRTVPKLVRSIP